MIFLNPIHDLVFKKLFGNNSHKNVVISFLNSVLDKKEGNRITEVSFLDTENLPTHLDSKYSIVDIRCTDQTGKEYIVEMQKRNQDEFGARATYYSSFAFSSQLNEKDKYKKLVPVIFVGVLNFHLFKSPSYISHHLILDTQTHVQEIDSLEFHFIELPKFKKSIHELETDLDKWLYLLRNATDLPMIPESFMKEPIFEEAFLILEQRNWTRTEIINYQRTLDIERSEAGQFDYAKREGKEEGRKEGRQEGRQEGRAEGELHAKLQIAKGLLDILDVETISKKIGLTVEQIKELKNAQ